MTKQRILAILLLVLGVALVGFFGMRAFHAFRKFSGHRPPPRDHIETDVSKIQDWMTVPYVSKTYHVPEKILFEAIGIPAQGNRNKSLKELNDKYYPNESGFVPEKIKTTILERQPPTPPSPATSPQP